MTSCRCFSKHPHTANKFSLFVTGRRGLERYGRQRAFQAGITIGNIGGVFDAIDAACRYVESGGQGIIGPNIDCAGQGTDENDHSFVRACVERYAERGSEYKYTFLAHGHGLWCSGGTFIHRSSGIRSTDVRLCPGELNNMRWTYQVKMLKD